MTTVLTRPGEAPTLDYEPQHLAGPGREAWMPTDPRYDLRPELISWMVNSYVEDHPDLPEGRLVGLTVRGGAMANVARSLECQVFNDSFGNGPQKMSELYGPYEQDSTWFMVLDTHKNIPVGVMRVVGNEAAYDMTLAETPDLIRMPEHLTREDKLRTLKAYHGINDQLPAWDVSTMAIDKSYRGKVIGTANVAGMLERMFVEEGTKLGIKNVFTLLDVKALRSLEGVGVPFETFYGPQKAFPYEGSVATLAMVGNFDDFRPSVRKKHEELGEESFLKNVLHRGLKQAIRRRILGKVAGMAALGTGVDEHIYATA